jgi:hypothetical protein
VPERFLRGAPFLAPMLFSYMSLVGLITLLDLVERLEHETAELAAETGV